MCAYRFLGLAFALFLALPSSSAEAGKFFFGPSEKLHVIAETKLINGAQPISLCYKTYTYFFLAGIYTTDDYVLCEGGVSERYWPIPAGEELAKLQSEGLLPSPFPSYRRDEIDYIIGYSLWLVLAVIALWGAVDHFRSKGGGEKDLALLKLTLRRVMARVAAVSPDRQRAVAKAIENYQAIFKEALSENDFLTDVMWVTGQPTAFDGFVGAMGRKFAKTAQPLLLQAAASIALSDGVVDADEAQVLRDLLKKLAVRRKDADAFMVALLKQSAMPLGASPAHPT